MAKRVNLNADMGESFGAWRMGDDDALLTVVGSANLACGFHAGDPMVMHRTVTRARDAGVSIGAHPGTPDLQGFGRRRLDLSAAEIETMVAYQIGALQAIAACAGARVTHVKPHGALYNLAAAEDEAALAIARAIKGVDPDLIFLCLAGSAMERAGERLGLKVAREAFCDRAYEDDGRLTPRGQPGAVIHDVAKAAERAVAMARDGHARARSGRDLALAVDSLCVHGDGPEAVAMARAVRTALRDAGIEVAPLPALFA